VLSEQESLLAAVFDEPDDNTVRLVYADWLEENEHAEQAEFVRVSIAYSRSEMFSDENIRLWHEIQPVWERFRERYPEIFHPLAFLTPLDFRRGFVDVLTASVDLWKVHSQSWWPTLPVRRAEFRLGEVNIADFCGLSALAYLDELILSGLDRSGAIVSRLGSCRHLRKLRILDLSNFEMTYDAVDALTKVGAFDSLQEVRVPIGTRPNRENGRLFRRAFGDLCQF